MRLSGRKSSSLTRRWTQRQRVVLLALLGINIAAFAVQTVVEVYAPGIVHQYLGLSGDGIHSAYAWQFATAIFLHDGPWHLIGNMLILYLLGRDVESIIGQRHFLFLYLAGAVIGELGHLFLMPDAAVLLGGSGAVAAVLVAYATILPELELTSMVFFVIPLRIKTKHLAYGALFIATVLLIVDRTGVVSHSAYLGGCAAGWLYAHLLGFGRPSFVQRALRQRQMRAERLERMTAEQFIAEEIDPLLDKISIQGLQSLTWSERRTLARAREKMAEPAVD
jgi:membrane associated rhomboid family serine protease